ncbi:MULTISPECIES: hypothetical protein [unclassified Streptomyces]|uniref:hypothetical protein n=1 Tax=unclassified Streptomyces TaxID=2593676 RepID=UPI0034291DCC
MSRHLQQAVGVVTRAILATVPGAVAEATRVTVDHTRWPMGVEAHDTWSGQAVALAERIVGALDSEQLVQGPQAPAELEKDTPGLVEPVMGAAFTPAVSVPGVRTELLCALALAAREYLAVRQLTDLFGELGEAVVCGPDEDEIARLVREICGLAHLPGPASSDDGGITVYRAYHDAIPVGLYLAPGPARRHCEALLSNEHPAATVTFDWIGDEEDPEELWELVVEIDGGPEQPTGYVVGPLRVDAEFDPEADS